MPEAAEESNPLAKARGFRQKTFMGRPRIHKKPVHSVKVTQETAAGLAQLQKEMTRPPLNPPSLGEVVAVLVSERKLHDQP